MNRDDFKKLFQTNEMNSGILGKQTKCKKVPTAEELEKIPQIKSLFMLGNAPDRELALQWLTYVLGNRKDAMANLMVLSITLGDGQQSDVLGDGFSWAIDYVGEHDEGEQRAQSISVMFMPHRFGQKPGKRHHIHSLVMFEGKQVSYLCADYEDTHFKNNEHFIDLAYMFHNDYTKIDNTCYWVDWNSVGQEQTHDNQPRYF